MRSFLLAIALLLVCPTVFAAQSMFDRVNDFDGDGKADYAITRNENGLKVWHVWRSSLGYLVIQWGIATDTVTAGDYDGDGKTDISVTRVANGPSGGNQGWIITNYHIASSTGALGISQFETINVVGSAAVSNEDYDGDGKTDVGFFQWHAFGGLSFRSSLTGTVRNVGMDWFLVRTGDVLGGSAADVVSHNPGNGQTTVRDLQGSTDVVQFGTHGDRWVPTDFNGDNKGELSLFRPSTGQWWSLQTGVYTFSVRYWGVNGDIPVPADYDGDSRTDLAIYRPGTSQNVYWVYGSTGGLSGFAFGIDGDVPVAY